MKAEKRDLFAIKVRNYGGEPDTTIDLVVYAYDIQTLLGIVPLDPERILNNEIVLEIRQFLYKLTTNNPDLRVVEAAFNPVVMNFDPQIGEIAKIIQPRQLVYELLDLSIKYGGQFFKTGNVTSGIESYWMYLQGIWFLRNRTIETNLNAILPDSMPEQFVSELLAMKDVGDYVCVNNYMIDNFKHNINFCWQSLSNLAKSVKIETTDAASIANDYLVKWRKNFQFSI